MSITKKFQTFIHIMSDPLICIDIKRLNIMIELFAIFKNTNFYILNSIPFNFTVLFCIICQTCKLSLELWRNCFLTDLPKSIHAPSASNQHDMYLYRVYLPQRPNKNIFLRKFVSLNSSVSKYASDTKKPTTWKIVKYNTPRPNLWSAAFSLSGRPLGAVWN